MTDKVAMAEKVLENIEWDGEGYMVDSTIWTEEIARAIASKLDIELTDRHFIVINFCRNAYKTEDDAPSLRKITKQTDVNTKELYALFPGGAAKTASKIAGLQKPTGCI